MNTGMWLACSFMDKLFEDIFLTCERYFLTE